METYLGNGPLRKILQYAGCGPITPQELKNGLLAKGLYGLYGTDDLALRQFYLDLKKHIDELLKLFGGEKKQSNRSNLNNSQKNIIEKMRALYRNMNGNQNKERREKLLEILRQVFHNDDKVLWKWSTPKINKYALFWILDIRDMSTANEFFKDIQLIEWYLNEEKENIVKSRGSLIRRYFRNLSNKTGENAVGKSYWPNHGQYFFTIRPTNSTNNKFYTLVRKNLTNTTKKRKRNTTY